MNFSVLYSPCKLVNLTPLCKLANLTPGKQTFAALVILILVILEILIVILLIILIVILIIILIVILIIIVWEIVSINPDADFSLWVNSYKTNTVPTK